MGNKSQGNPQQAQSDADVRDLVADRGLPLQRSRGMFAEQAPYWTYIRNPDRPPLQANRWTDTPETQPEAAYANLRPSQGHRGKRLERRRSETVERSPICGSPEARGELGSSK